MSPLILSKFPVFNGVIKSIIPLIDNPVIPPVIRFPAFRRYSREPSFGIRPSVTLKFPSPDSVFTHSTLDKPVQETLISPVTRPYICPGISKKFSPIICASALSIDISPLPDRVFKL